MATKKSKSSNKSEKTKSTKSKNAEKSVKKTELEATDTTSVEEKTTKKKVEDTESTKKSTEKTAEKSTEEKSHSDESTKIVSKEKKSCLSGFFAKKYEQKESILTIFKDHKFYGAIIGEVLGTMFVTLLLFSVSFMGPASIATYIIALIATLIAIYAISGACLNPIITVGMMASRRMSVIRGVMYIIAEVVGAWIGWLIFNAFHLAGGENAVVDLPAMTAIGEGQFWIFAAIEIIGAIIIAFFFARALKYKRSVFTFAAVVAGGISLAFIFGYIISAAFMSLNNNFIMNPAVAMMLQIFPTAGDNFGEILGGICQAFSVFALLPMIGGVVGFYLSDFTTKLSGDE